MTTEIEEVPKRVKMTPAGNADLICEEERVAS